MTEEKLTEVRRVLEEVLRSRFPNTEFTSLRVRPDLDHYGDEILRVKAFYRGGDAELDDADRAADVIIEMRHRLRAIGETAFPSLEYRNPEVDRWHVPS